MSCIQLEHVNYRYDRQPVLEDISLTLQPGEILGLFGHNGAGKTTIIKLVLGLLKPERGHLSVLGGEAGDPKIRQHIGYLPENVMFYPQLTGREILSHFARLKGAPLSQVPELFDQVGLAGAINERVKTYSKGMRQRLGLAQALLGKPRLLMLDEPTVGLDPVATADLYRLLRQLLEDGVAVVLCSHVLPGVEPYIDRAVILADGQVRASGSLAELRQRADMPVRLKADVSSLPGDVARLFSQSGTMEATDTGLTVEVGTREKLSTLRQLLALEGITDLHIEQPTLENLYCHFVGPSGLGQGGRH